MAMTKLSENGLIHADDLYYILGGGRERVKLLDATYALPGPMANTPPFQAYLERHIDGAQFFDIDVVADQDAPLPHTAPTADYFAACASALGIGNDDHVVIYDQSGMYMASSRAWWLFRLFGHENVYVLDGGLGAWVTKGFPLASGPAEPPVPTDFKAKLRSGLIVSRNDLMDNLITGRLRVLDARPEGRFQGTMAEPRPGMRAGHIPGSYNLPFGHVIDARSRQIADETLLEGLFTAQGAGADDQLAVTCGSGVTACTVALALYKLRGQEAAIYDGSWSEWGDETAGTPVEISA